MNDTGTILIFIGIFLLGALLGFVIYHVSLGKKRTGVKQQELDETKAELEQYKEKVNDHFMNSAGLMQQVATSYQALHNHMATQSESLLSEKGMSPYPLLGSALPQTQEETLLEETATTETPASETDKIVNEESLDNQDKDVESVQEDTIDKEEATVNDASEIKEETAVQETSETKETPEVSAEEKVDSEKVPVSAQRPKDYVENTADTNDAVEKSEEPIEQPPKVEKK